MEERPSGFGRQIGLMNPEIQGVDVLGLIAGPAKGLKVVQRMVPAVITRRNVIHLKQAPISLATTQTAIPIPGFDLLFRFLRRFSLWHRFAGLNDHLVCRWIFGSVPSCMEHTVHASVVL